MIIYDSSNYASIVFQLKGSVFPRAIGFALPATTLALLLKLLVTEFGGPVFEEQFNENVGSNISVAGYSTFTFVLGFMLVFRTSQAYNRFWEGKALVCKMRAEWYEACASLVAFSTKSKNDPQEVDNFRHTLVRLFSLLHASALEEIACKEEEEFNVLDVQGLDETSRDSLFEWQQEGKGKVHLAFQWILGTVVNNMDSGCIPVPPPILTRVFQELSSGKVHMEDALKITDTQFPFPYAQMTIVLLFMHSLMTPLVVCIYTGHWSVAGVFTFASVFLLWCINFIAVEIEQPFGDDANDLDTDQMQVDMNEALLALLDPATIRLPTLSKRAEMKVQNLHRGQTSFNQADALRRSRKSRVRASLLSREKRESTLSASKRESTLSAGSRQSVDVSSPELVPNAKMVRISSGSEKVSFDSSAPISIFADEVVDANAAASSKTAPHDSGTDVKDSHPDRFSASGGIEQDIHLDSAHNTQSPEVIVERQNEIVDVIHTDGRDVNSFTRNNQSDKAIHVIACPGLCSGEPHGQQADEKSRLQEDESGSGVGAFDDYVRGMPLMQNSETADETFTL